MIILKNEDTQKGLDQAGRVYLCGNLKAENAAPFFRTDGYEMGISEYKEYTFEKAHIHTCNTEYNYVISGAVKFILIKEMKEYTATAGDLFIIQTDEPYVCKQLPGTKVIFSKTPGGNDKMLWEMDETLLKWGEAWENMP